MAAIDEGALRLLLDDMGGDNEVVKELIQAFLEEVPKQLAEGRAAIGKSDLPTAQRSYHTIKSTAATFGAAQLSALCKEMEAGAKGGKMPTLDQCPPASSRYPWSTVMEMIHAKMLQYNLRYCDGCGSDLEDLDPTDLVPFVRSWPYRTGDHRLTPEQVEVPLREHE